MFDWLNAESRVERQNAAVTEAIKALLKERPGGLTVSEIRERIRAQGFSESYIMYSLTQVEIFSFDGYGETAKVYLNTAS